MKKTENIKVNYYFDEAGDPNILGRKGVNLIEEEQASNKIGTCIQQASEITLLQAADYVLWTIQRAYQNGDFRYYNYIKEKIALVHDIFDFVKYPKNYYTPKNPLEAKKIDPV